MKVLFVSAEVSPFSVSGGLGDVAGALPVSIRNTFKTENTDDEVSVISPLYKTTEDLYKSEMTHVGDLIFNLAWRKTGCSVYKLEKNNLSWYFIENNYYFSRDRLYGEYDDGERFAFFSIATLEFIRFFIADLSVIHTNDWHTALCNIYLKTIYKEQGLLQDIKSVFTIHNIQYQGIYDPYILGDVFGLDEKYKSLLEFEGKINLLKGGIVCADKVTTVSKQYAQELKYDYFSHGLSSIIRMNEQKISGIINGIDYNIFSPKRGLGIYNFGKRDFASGKKKNRELIAEEFGIELNENISLAVMITRLTEQKGIDLLLRIGEELLRENIFLIVLGSGDEKYETALSELSARHPNFAIKIGFNRELSMKLYAAADIFLMPSKTEPCGLAQMIACSFGAIPIVHSVGGLYDTIIPYNEAGSNGFSFKNYNAHDFLYTIKDALILKNDKKEWRALILRAMNSDFSWRNSAQKYISVYRDL